MAILELLHILLKVLRRNVNVVPWIDRFRRAQNPSIALTGLPSELLPYGATFSSVSTAW